MINEELFLLIEKKGPEGITAAELAEHLGLKLSSAHTMLSRWAKKNFLEYVPVKGKTYDPNRPRIDGKLAPGRPKGAAGRYRIGEKCKWWGELRYEGNLSREMAEEVEYPEGRF